jgi:NitT/TauT family transport system substrate-binding protein
VNRLLVALLLTGSLCVPALRAGAAAPTVRLSMICETMTPMLAQLAVDDGAFDRAGLMVEKYCFTGGDQAIAALLTGTVDVHIGSYELVLRQRLKGVDLKAYAQIYDGMSYALLVKAGSPIKSLADLRGRSIGVTGVGTLSDSAARAALDEAGLDPARDVHIVGTGSGTSMSSLFAALETNRVDAGMLAEPMTTQLVADGKYRLLWAPKIPYAGNVLIARTAWVAAHRSTMRALLAALKSTYARTVRDPSSAVAPLARDFPTIQRRILLQAIKGQLTHIPKDLQVTRGSTATVLDAALKSGELKAPIPYEAAVDGSLLGGTH